MFNFVYIMRDYTGYFDAFCANRKKTLRYKHNEKVSAFMMKVASYISDDLDDYTTLSSWRIECNGKPIAYLDFYGKNKYRCVMLIKNIRVSDLDINFLYCNLMSSGNIGLTA